MFNPTVFPVVNPCAVEQIIVATLVDRLIELIARDVKFTVPPELLYLKRFIVTPSPPLPTGVALTSMIDALVALNDPSLIQTTVTLFPAFNPCAVLVVTRAMFDARSTLTILHQLHRQQLH